MTSARPPSLAIGLGALAALLAGCDRRPDDIPVVVSVIGGKAGVGERIRGPLPRPVRVVRGAIAQGLVSFDANGNIEPALAERWIVTDDGRSFIFRLRTAEWADGSRVTSTDVARALTAALAANRRNALAPFLTAIDEIVAMTPQVVEVRLSRPRPDLLKLFAQPEMAVIAPGMGGAGPFRTVSGGPVDALRLRPEIPYDENGERPVPLPEEHVILRGERASMAVMRFARRESDLVDGGTIVDWPLVALAGIAPANTRVDPARGLFGLVVADRTGFLADPMNRGAIALAIDRPALTAAFRDNWAPVERILPDQQDSAAPPAAGEWAAIADNDRRDAARARLAAWGKPVTLSIALPDGPGATQLWARLAADLRAVGFRVERVAMDAPAQLRLVDSVAPYDSARWYLRTACQPCSPQAAALIEAARDADTLDLRGIRLAEADAAMALDTAFIPIAAPLRWSLVATRLRAWSGNARAWHPLNRLRRTPN